MTAKRAFSLIELLVAVSIGVVLSTLAYKTMRPMMDRSNVVSEMTRFKAMLNRAKAKAMETSAPVKVDLSAGTMLVFVDLDRGGNFGRDANGAEDLRELVLGESLTTGVGFSGAKDHVHFVQAGVGDQPPGPIPHPSGAYDIDPSDLQGYTTFEDDSFLITPQGLIRSAKPPYSPVNGSFFFRSNDSFLFTLVHITGLGEVRTAIKNKAETEWVWQ